jgi:hypothetical protein
VRRRAASQRAAERELRRSTSSPGWIAKRLRVVDGDRADWRAPLQRDACRAAQFAGPSKASTLWNTLPTSTNAEMRAAGLSNSLEEHFQ